MDGFCRIYPGFDREYPLYITAKLNKIDSGSIRQIISLRERQHKYRSENIVTKSDVQISNNTCTSFKDLYRYYLQDQFFSFSHTINIDTSIEELALFYTIFQHRFSEQSTPPLYVSKTFSKILYPSDFRNSLVWVSKEEEATIMSIELQQAFSDAAVLNLVGTEKIQCSMIQNNISTSLLHDYLSTHKQRLSNCLYYADTTINRSLLNKIVSYSGDKHLIIVLRTYLEGIEHLYSKENITVIAIGNNFRRTIPNPDKIDHKITLSSPSNSVHFDSFYARLKRKFHLLFDTDLCGIQLTFPKTINNTIPYESKPVEYNDEQGFINKTLAVKDVEYSPQGDFDQNLKQVMQKLFYL